MKKILPILFLFLSLGLSAQRDSSFMYISPHGSWKVKSLIYVDYGFTYFSSDLGTHTNFTTALGGMFYNVSEKNADIVFEYRVLYQNFGGHDDYRRLYRDFIAVGGGVGIHLDELVFGTFNLTHYWVLDPGEKPLSTMAATMKGEFVAVGHKKWSLMLGVEAGVSFQDLDFIDGPLSADKYEGTGLFRFTMSIVRKL